MSTGSRVRKWIATVFTTVLVLFTAFVLLDTLVIAHPYATVAAPGTTAIPSSPVNPTGTSSFVPPAPACGLTPESEPMTYTDQNRAISVAQYRVDSTDVIVADILLTDPAYLFTAFAENTYGRNVTASTSAIAEASGAILAVNGDFYGARRSGYVVRDGVVYRSEPASADQEDLAVMGDGTWRIIREGDISASDLIAQGATDVFSFGPGLVDDGRTVVGEGTEVDRAQASNPRTAIAWVGGSHYLFVVADGRTSASAGLDLDGLGDFLAGCGAQTAYNLDGGGSSTMWFEGRVVNHPTDGRSNAERKVSDIVYV